MQKTKLNIPMRLEAMSNPVLTRMITSTDIQNSLFNEGQLISAYMPVTGASDNTTSLGSPLLLKAKTAENGVNPLVPSDESTLYFPPGENVNISINAVYPSSVSSSVTTFSVRNPQTTDDDYINSDLMFAYTSTPKTNQAVHLQFAHQMAKLVVKASGVDDLTIKTITLKSIYTSVEFDSSQSPWELTSTSGSKTDMVMASSDSYVSSLTGVALFPPQTKEDTYFMEVQVKTLTGTEGTAYFLIGEKLFEGGKEYIINLKVGPKNLQEGDAGKVVISPWPASVGTINVEAVGNLGLTITSLADDGSTSTNSLQGGGNDKYYIYNGKNCTPIPTVTDGKEVNPATLTVGTDYDVAYYNNINAGTAIIVVTGKGHYAGLSTFATFPIRRTTNTMQYPAATKSSTLSRGGIVDHHLQLPSFQTKEVYGQMTFKLFSDAGMTNEITSGGIATVDAYGNVYMVKRGGPIYVQATMDDTGNFESKTVSYALTITAGDAATAMTVEWTNGSAFSYTGNAIEPEFVVKDNSSILALGASNDYTYAFSNNTNVGNQATLTITGHNEYEGTKVVYFTIEQADNSWVTLNEPSKPIDCGDTKLNPQGDRNVTLSIAAETFNIGGVPKFGTTVTYSSANGNVATVDANGVITGKAAGSTTITATVAGTSNYKVMTKTIPVTVEKMTYIFVYNGVTEHVDHGNFGGTVGQIGDKESDTYWAQSLGGSVQTCNLTFTRNATVYALVVGAGGGCDGTNGSGGLGGYVKAHKEYDQGSTTFYVWCGGGGYSDSQGNDNDRIRAYGGWNGGGRTGISGCSGAGGGATVVATTNSETNWDFSANDSRLLVAGAGGGASNQGNGGESGGDKDDVRGTMSGIADNYTARKKWQGGRASINGEMVGGSDELSATDGGGGGAGYYGGLGGQENNSGGTKATGGHGGSNFIHSSWVTDSHGTTSSASSTFNDIGFTMSANGFLKNDNGIIIDSAIRCWPGYVIIKFKYDR